MKLLTFDARGSAHVGAVAPEGIVDLTQALAITHPDVRVGGSLLDIISRAWTSTKLRSNRSTSSAPKAA